MAEYIEREFNPCDVCSYKRCSNCVLHELAMKVVEHHAADVAPVVHGRWENVCHYPYPDTIRCSVCGREFNGNEDWKGCPVCLARMDGE